MRRARHVPLHRRPDGVPLAGVPARLRTLRGGVHLLGDSPAQRGHCCPAGVCALVVPLRRQPRLGEAFDGVSWRYLGACEPEPVLDRGWFTYAAARAVMVHTRAFVQGGREEAAFLFPHVAPQDWDIQEGVAVENITARYAPVKELEITVLGENGSPAAGAWVSVAVMNMAAPREIARRRADDRGRVTLKLGKGTGAALRLGGQCPVPLRGAVGGAGSLLCLLDLGTAASRQGRGGLSGSPGRRFDCPAAEGGAATGPGSCPGPCRCPAGGARPGLPGLGGRPAPRGARQVVGFPHGKRPGGACAGPGSRGRVGCLRLGEEHTSPSF